MKMLEAVADKGPVRWAAWTIVSQHDRGMLDDVAQTVAMKFLRNHSAEKEMLRAYWCLAGKRVAIAMMNKESRYARFPQDGDGDGSIELDHLPMLADSFNLEAWMTLREIVSRPVGREVAALVLDRDSGAVTTPSSRQRLHRARKELRKVAQK